MNILLSLLIAIFCLQAPKVADAACSVEQPTIREQFALSPVVARLNYTGDTATLPCGLEVFDESTFSYVITDTFGSFQVLQVFKGDLDEASVPLFLTTDMGFWATVESRFEQDTEGFLAFLVPYRRCQVANGPSYPYPDGSGPTPYSMSTCVSANTPWSQVPEDDKIFLQSSGVGADTPSSSIPSEIPSEAPSGAPTAPPATITKAPIATPTPKGGTGAKEQTKAPVTASPSAPITASPVVAETPSPVAVTKKPTSSPIPPLTPFPTQVSAAESQSLGDSGGIRTACSLVMTLLLVVAGVLLVVIV